MIDIQLATKIILSNTIELPKEEVPLTEALGRILMEDLIADRDFPPFTRVSMDGISIRFEEFEKGRRDFPIEGIQAAGSPQKSLLNNHACLEVMTGAVLPKNTDTVIRYEDLAIENGIAKVLIENIRPRQNAHQQGVDRNKGEQIVSAGKRISAAEIGVAATVGESRLKVSRIPFVLIISTGDELVGISDTPLPHQIRSSNVYAIQAALKNWGVPADIAHFQDDKKDIESGLDAALQKYDAILISGGVSKGKYDYIPEVLEKLKVKKLFHRVSQRPGKPFWFGKAQSGTVVFALPGNPVSAFMCTQRYFRPWLNASLGLDPFLFLKYASLIEDFHFKPDLTYFLQVKVEYNKEGSISAKPVAGKGSGDLANLTNADGFLELPQDKDFFQKGEVYPVILFRQV
ncbi:MAG: molybdopterin molybdotransferase MoeA [Bacteroidetes bacterium]|nr:molybdopterin molybdotransferase MoeA [Bacteroidota bacterium]